jgi:hypothetical protein
VAYDPEIWLESTVREIKDYAVAGFTNAVLDAANMPAGDDVYDIVMEFPGPTLDNSDNPLAKTLVHFEADDIQDMPVGIGENVYADNFIDGGTDPDTVNPQYAGKHMINFDVGIWASSLSGGLTSRLRARQILYDLFGSPLGVMTFQNATDSGDGRVEILNYTGGQFIEDRINDVPVYRMINGQLVVRVFSRTKLSDTPEPAIEEILQAPNVTILG